MGRQATDADFNASSQYITMQIEIYFDGPTAQPFLISINDYLIDVEWLEGLSETTNPFGAVSSNELSFTLSNEDGLFTPTNNTSPFYGKIKRGIKVIPYLRPNVMGEDIDWLKLGEFYVTSWDAVVTGITANIVANDAWHLIFNSPAPDYPIEHDVSFYDALTNIYIAMGFEVQVDTSLEELLLYSFIEGEPLDFTQEILTGAMSYCTSNKDGVPVVSAFLKNRPLRGTLLDSNQIVNATASQPINRVFDGVELTYTVPQGMAQEQLVDLRDLHAPAGTFQVENLGISRGPLWKVISVLVQSREVRLENYTATPWYITLNLRNSGDPATVGLVIHGQTVGFTEFLLPDEGIKPLKVKNRYIQNEEYAQKYKSVLEALVQDSIPMLALEIVSNPLLAIGDRVLVQSDRYKLNYNGLIMQMKYKYRGGLSCEMTLLNANLLQGV